MWRLIILDVCLNDRIRAKWHFVRQALVIMLVLLRSGSALLMDSGDRLGVDRGNGSDNAGP